MHFKLYSPVLSRSLKLQLSGFSSFSIYFPYTIPTRLTGNLFWATSFLKLRNALELLFLHLLPLSLFYLFLLLSLLLHIIPWIQVCLEYVWSWVGDFSLKDGVQIRTSYKGKYWNDSFNSSPSEHWHLFPCMWSVLYLISLNNDV